MPKILINRIIR